MSTPRSTLTDDLNAAAATTPTSDGGGSDLDSLRARLSEVEAEKQKLAAEREQLARYREMGRRMMRNDGTFTPEREEAMRFLMDDSGFTPDEIERWVEVQRLQAEGADDDDAAPADPEPPTSGDDLMEDQPRPRREDPRDREIRELRERLERLTEHVSATQTSTLESRINDQVTRALDSHQGVSSLLGVSARLNGEEGLERRRQMFADDLRQQTVAELRRRKARGGQFREDWIPEAVEKAAADITERYRSVIGDPDKIRRSPETGTGQDELRPIEPPKDPIFEPGDDAGKVTAKALEFTEGTLLSIAQEASKDGKSLT